MAKIWDGPTPYDLVDPDTGKPTWSIEGRAKVNGYREAMNSLTVKALYEALKKMRLIDLMGTPGAQEALAAYKAGLREEA